MNDGSHDNPTPPLELPPPKSARQETPTRPEAFGTGGGSQAGEKTEAFAQGTPAPQAPGQQKTDAAHAKAPVPSLSNPPEAKGHVGCAITVLILLALLAGGGYYYYFHMRSDTAGSATQPSAGGEAATGAGGSGGRGGGRGGRGGAGGGAGRPLPVIAAQARSGDFPIYIDALGTITALNTVTLRSRVDGEVIKVLYTEGQMVKQGDTLVEVDPRPYQAALTQAEGQLKKDQASLKNATADLERYMAAKETVSQQQIDTAQASVDNFKGAIEVDQGVIDNAKLQLSYCHITSPLTGKIGLRMVDEGNIIHASDTAGLAVITQLQPISVIFNLPQINLPAVLNATKGDKELPVEIYNADRTQKLASGSLKAIDNEIDTLTGTVKIKAVVDNADLTLYPNEFVNVRLLVDTLKDVTLVPSGAIQRSPTTMFVYAIKPDKTVEMRPVAPGPTEAGTAVVENGLDPGESVVVEGLDKLAPGMSVTLGRATTRPSGDRAATRSGGVGEAAEGQRTGEHRSGNGGGNGGGNGSTTRRRRTQ